MLRFGRVQGVQGLGIRVRGSGFRVQGSRLRVEGLGLRFERHACFVHRSHHLIRFSLLDSRVVCALNGSGLAFRIQANPNGSGFGI